MGKKPQSRLIYRDNKTGRFITDEEGEERPKEETTHERLPLPGYGDTGRYNKS